MLRTLHPLGVSISTGLALETILPNIQRYDPERKIEVKDIRNYDIFYINIFTLIRNILNALDKGEKHKFFKRATETKALYETVLEEIANIRNVIGGDVKVVFFGMDYERFKKLQLRADNPKLFGSNNTLIYLAYKDIFKKLKRNNVEGFTEVHNHLESNQKPILLLSHVPIDLLSRKKCPSMELLESHTGKIIDGRHFGKKYLAVSGEDMSHLPFCEVLLAIFGDKAIVQPAPIKIRRDVFEEAMKKRWIWSTSCMMIRGMQYIKMFIKTR